MSDDAKLYEVVLSDKISPENCVKFGCPNTSHVLILSDNGDFHDPSKDFVGYVYEHGTKKYIWNDKWYYQTDLPNSAEFAQYLRDLSIQPSYEPDPPPWWLGRFTAVILYD